MRSVASLTYEEAQAALDGAPDDQTGPLLETVIKPLYAAYARAERARGSGASRWTSTCRNGGSSWTRTARSPRSTSRTGSTRTG